MMYPKSFAATVASIDSPMFVGEVRMKISRVGVSWTLSGGNQEVCGPTKSSKYLHVRRAAVRRNRRSSDVSDSAAPAFRRAIDHHHRHRKERPQKEERGCGYHRRWFPATPRRRKGARRQRGSKAG